MSSRSRGAPLEELFSRYSNFVFRIWLRYTRNREEAEAGVAEVFARLGKELEAHRGDDKPRTWIYRTSIGLCLNAVRSRKIRRGLDLEELDVEVLRVLESQCGPLPPGLVLERILGKLSPLTRRILFLKYLEGLSREEITQTLEAAPEVIGRRLEDFTFELKALARALPESNPSAA